MIELDITNSDLFDSLLEISYGKTCYDIHNDFNLKSIKYVKQNDLLSFEFIKIEGRNSIVLAFEDVDILSFDIPNNQEDLTIDNFHRGRYEYSNHLYDEFNDKKCFYMEFYEDGEFSFLCSRAVVKIFSKSKI